MTKAEYAERKAAGRCLGSSSCKRSPRPGRTLCGHCKDLRTDAKRAYRHRRQVLGYCAYGGCKEKPEGNMCAAHQARQTEHELRWQRLNRARVKANERRWKKKRVTRGQCVRCARPLRTETLCQRCRGMDLKRGREWRRQHGVKPDTRNHCSACGKVGHRYTTCESRYRVEIDVAEFATARGEWL